MGHQRATLVAYGRGCALVRGGSLSSTRSVCYTVEMPPTQFYSIKFLVQSCEEKFLPTLLLGHSFKGTVQVPNLSDSLEAC